MYNLIEKRYWFFGLSLLIIIPGLIAMGISLAKFGAPWRLSIDFTGGAIMELRFEQKVVPGEIYNIFLNSGYGDTTVQTTLDEKTVLIRSKPLDEKAKAELQAKLREKFGPFEELRYESVGPAVGKEVTRAATIAVIAASFVILGFIVFAFRKVPNAFRYGVCAIIAMIHDVLVATGLFSIAGLVLGWEVDALFITALLTVIGFSVQDTIVVFDRIRENTPKRRGEPFEIIVTRSLLETLHRSLVTQLNAIFVLIAVLLFGGATMKQFVAVLLVGLISGTYSSICNAVPLLVVWENKEIPKLINRIFKRQPQAA
ncbi:MAG: protein translocase subunit SecF [Chloroflexi bacterium]|nr:MAG: protein translocase subunit SecF [Chloroflexota bacterium]HDN80883.1 protein translocase subunit SecF [Chloroflexota bacterium]